MRKKRESGHALGFDEFITETGESVRKNWKRIASRKIYAFAAHHAPLRVKMGGKYLWVDDKERTNAIVLRGLVPYASMMRGWKAPKRREHAKPHPVWDEAFGWRTIRNKAKLTSNPGVEIRDVDYGDGRRPNLGFFGAKKGGESMAFGLSSIRKGKNGLARYKGESVALPVYASESVVEWISDEQMDEVMDIIVQTKKDV